MRGLFIFAFFFVSSVSFSQKTPISLGVAGGYNFQTQGLGYDIRATKPLSEQIRATLRYSGFPSFNIIKEKYLGLDLEYIFHEGLKIDYYGFLGMNYDNWQNASDFKSNIAKKNNFVLEGGIGAEIKYQRFRPFAEWRYDTKWKEGTLFVGLKFGLNAFAKKDKYRCGHF